MKKLSTLLAVCLSFALVAASVVATARDAGPNGPPTLVPSVAEKIAPTVATPTLAEFHDHVAAIGAQVATQPTLPPTYNAAVFGSYQSGDKTSKGHIQFDAVINVQLGQFTHIAGKKWVADYGTFLGAAVNGKSSGVAGAWIGKTNIPLADQVKGMAALAASINSGQAPHIGLILGITIALGNSK